MHQRTTLLSRRAVLAACVVTALGVRPAVAGDVKELLKFVPQDAWGFVIVKSIENLDAKGKLLSEKLGVSIPPLSGMITGNPILPLGDTLDPRSPIGLVVLDMQTFDNKGVAALVPTKDPEAFLKKLSAGAADDEDEDAAEDDGNEGDAEEAEEADKADAGDAQEGVRKVRIMGQTLYALVKDRLVVLSPEEDVAVKVVKTKKAIASDFDPARAAAMSASDVYVSLSPRLILKSFKDMIMNFLPMLAGPSGMDAASLEQVLEMISQIAALDVCVRVNEEGVTLTALVCPAKESTLEKVFADTKNASEPLLGRLPKERFLFTFGGVVSHSKHAKELGEESLISSVIKSAESEGIDGKVFKSLLDDLRKMEDDCNRFALCAALLSDTAQGLFGVTAVVETKDARRFVEGVRKCYKSVCTLSDDEDFQKAVTAFAHTPDAETVDGRQVDTIGLDLAKLGDDIEEEEVEKINKVLGEDITLRFGAADDKHVVVTFGGGQERYKAACQALKGGSGMSSEASIAAVASRLPMPRTSEAFIAVDTILRAVKKAAKAVGDKDEIPFDVPEINAPVAISGSMQGKITRGDVHVPMKLMTAVKKMIDESTKAEMNAFDEEEEDEDADEAPMPGKKAPAKDDDSEDEEEDDDGR